MLKKQNALIVETLGNFEKANYQNKMLEISRSMPELPYLSFTYPEWATFEEFKKVAGYPEISAAYNFKSYIIGAIVNSKAYVFIKALENKYYYVNNMLLLDEKQIGKIKYDLHNRGNYNDQTNYNSYYAETIEKNNASYNAMQYEITNRFNSSCNVEKSKIKGLRNYYCNKLNNYIGLFRIGFLLLNPKFYEYNLEYSINLSADRPIINLYVRDKLRTHDYTLIKADNQNLPNLLDKSFIYEKLVNYPSHIYYDIEE